MRYSNIRSWSLDNAASSSTGPINFYLDLTDEAKQAHSLEQAIRQAANILNRLFPMFQFKVDVQTTPTEKTRHIIVDNSGCKAEIGAHEDRHGNKYSYMSCFIGGGWRGDWKTHNVDSIIHELLHTIGRNHEQLQPDALGLIQYFNSRTKLPSEEFLEYYDPWSLMHYSLRLISVVIGEARVAPQTTVMESLAKQAYPKELARDYYEALLGLNENNGNFDAFNLGFGLLTQRDFNTLYKIACIIDPKMYELKWPTPLIAFTTNNKISYRYLLKLIKLFVNPDYQKQKPIVMADANKLEIESNRCYRVNLKDYFQIYPKEQTIRCEILTTVLQGSNVTQFSDSDFPRKEGDSCILRIKKGFLDHWDSSLQSRVIFYSDDHPSSHSSSTLQWWHNQTQSQPTLSESSICLSIPNSESFHVMVNTTWTPFLNSEMVSGSHLDSYERNKYFFRLVLNGIPFFAAGLATGINHCAEWVISSYFNETLFNRSSRYLKYFTQWTQFFIHIGLTSYAMHQHILEEKARQLLIPFLDENKQLFQTVDLMDKLNCDEFLPLVLPYVVNTATLLILTLITPNSPHWSTRLGLTNALAILIACIANQGNPYSYLELTLGISVYIGGAFIGYGLTWCSLSLLKKLKTHLQWSGLIKDTPLNNQDHKNRVSLIEEQEEQTRVCSTPKETLSVTEAIKCAWNTVSFSKLTIAVSHSSFFNFCRSSEKYEKIDFQDHICTSGMQA